MESKTTTKKLSGLTLISNNRKEDRSIKDRFHFYITKKDIQQV